MATTTTTVTSTTTVRTVSFFDVTQINSVSGILKVIEMVLDFITFICCVAGGYAYSSYVGWATFVSISAFIVTLLLFLMYLTHLIERLHTMPWLLIECVYCAIWVFFFLIAGGLMASMATVENGGAFGAASFFAFVTMIVYGFDCFTKFNGWRNGDMAQGTPPTVAMRSSGF